MWQDEYEKLNTTDRERFTRLISLLLAKTFILRDKYSSKDMAIKINHDYRFIERHIELFQDYLRVAGWDLQKDDNYGVIALYNIYEMNRVRVSKNTTSILYVLRLIYEEEREKLSLKREIITKVSHVMETMINIGVINKKISNKDLVEAFSFLRRFNIIDKVEGDFTDPETSIIIYPSILFIVTNDKISEIYDMTIDEDEEEDIPDDENFAEE